MNNIQCVYILYTEFIIVCGDVSTSLELQLTTLLTTTQVTQMMQLNTNTFP